MPSSRGTTLATAAVACGFLCGAALGQCPGWSTQFAGSDVNGNINVMTVFDDGTGPALYIGGTFSSISGVPFSNISRWNGQQWQPVGSGTNGEVRTLCILPGAAGPSLVAGGNFTTAGGVPAQRVARWAGSGWSAFPGFPPPSVTSLVVADVGAGPTLCVVGSSSNPSVYSFTGSGWSPVGSISNVDELCVHDDGSGPRLLASSSVFGGTIYAWNGATWTTPGDPNRPNNYIYAMLDRGPGQPLWVGGAFTTAGGEPAGRVATWDGTTWHGIPGLAGHVYTLASGPEQDGGRIWAGGSDLSLSPRSYAASLASDGSWSLTTGIDGTPLAFASFASGPQPRWFAGGEFTKISAVGTAVDASTHLARLDGNHWVRAGRGANMPPTRIATVHENGTEATYVGGNFVWLGDQNAPYLARWDGTVWTPIAGPQGSSSLFSLDDGNGEALYVQGTLSINGAPAASGLAKWDGSHWTGFPSSSSIGALTAFDDGTGIALYSNGGTDGNTVLRRWDGQAWQNVPGSGTGAMIRQMVTFDNGTGPAIYATAYSNIGPIPETVVARWDGHAWSAVGQAFSIPPPLVVLDRGQGNELFAYAAFSSGPPEIQGIARWNGASWEPVGAPISGNMLTVLPDPVPTLVSISNQPFGPGSLVELVNGAWQPFASANAAINVLATGRAAGSPALIAGGPFTTIGGVQSERIAIWSCPPRTCYANCDRSTASPFLNVLDLSCFLQKFAAGDTYANCDGSTVAPVLNVADFACFLQKFAAGCP